MPSSVTIDRRQLSRACEQHGICRLSLFGSALRSDFGPASDVDVLAEFEPGRTPGLLRLHVIEQELSSAFAGRVVDLATPGCLNRLIRDAVLAEAEVEYESPQ